MGHKNFAKFSHAVGPAKSTTKLSTLRHLLVLGAYFAASCSYKVGAGVGIGVGVGGESIPIRISPELLINCRRLRRSVK